MNPCFASLGVWWSRGADPGRVRFVCGCRSRRRSPVWCSRSRRTGSVDVPLGARIVVTFSDPVDDERARRVHWRRRRSTGAFCLVGPNGPVDAAADVVGDGKSVQFADADARSRARRYTLFVGRRSRRRRTNLPATARSFTFTTRTDAAASPRRRRWSRSTAAIRRSPTSFRPMFETLDDPAGVLRAARSAHASRSRPGAIELLDSAGHRGAGDAASPTASTSRSIRKTISPPARRTRCELGNSSSISAASRSTPTTVTLTPQNSARHADRSRRCCARGRPAIRARRSRAPARAERDRDRQAADRQADARTCCRASLAAELGDPKALGGPIAFTIRKGQRLRADAASTSSSAARSPSGCRPATSRSSCSPTRGGRMYRNPHQAGRPAPRERARAALRRSQHGRRDLRDRSRRATRCSTQTVLGVQATGIVDRDRRRARDRDRRVDGPRRCSASTSAPTNLVLELITDADRARRRRHDAADAASRRIPADGATEHAGRRRHRAHLQRADRSRSRARRRHPARRPTPASRCRA